MANKLEVEFGRTDLKYIYRISHSDSFFVSIVIDGVKTYVGGYRTLNKAVKARNYALRGKGFVPSCNPIGRPPSNLR